MISMRAKARACRRLCKKHLSLHNGIAPQEVNSRPQQTPSNPQALSNPPATAQPPPLSKPPYLCYARYEG